MEFLADESCDFAVVRALRQAGYNVLAVSEIARGAPDEKVLKLAVTGKRLLLTEDKDFGQWVYAEKRATAGVILLRYPAAARRMMPRSVLRLVEQHGERLAGCFVVVQPGQTRVTPAKRQ